MIVIPAIELSAGPLARILPGVPLAAEGSQPAAVTRVLADVGFSRVQLDGFSGGLQGGAHTPVLEEIVRDTDLTIQVAVASSESDIERLFRMGAEYIVVGSRAVEEPEWLAEMAALYPDAIVVTTDVRDRKVVRRGWVRTVPIDVMDLADDLNALPLAGILVSGLKLDGPSRLADLAVVEDLVDRSDIPVLVSGKVATMSDLRALEHRGAAAIVLRSEHFDGELEVRMVAREFGS